MGKFLPCIKSLSSKILPIAFGELIVTIGFLAFSPENFRTKILQEAAVQSTSHFHVLFLKTSNVTSFEYIEMSPSLQSNDISTDCEFSLLYKTRNFIILFKTAPQFPLF